MADLKPIGSEKLQGQDKINRILEIARYKETRPSSINETSRIEFGKTLADGQHYEIVKEKLGYVIKKNINESLDYIEPMKNRKYYKSYSQALKRLNLLAGELNRLNENDEEVSMFTLEEQKKFTLKLPKQEVPAPAPEPAPEAPADDVSMDLDMDLSADAEGGDESMDMDMEMDAETPEMGAEEEEVDFKVIQKLTGKLGQKIRTMNDSVGMTSEDIKYVLNSILSALDLEKLDDEDKEDIIAKIEEVETDYESDEMDIDMTGDEEMDMDLGMDVEEPVEGEMGEGDDRDEFDGRDSEVIGVYSNIKKQRNEEMSEEEKAHSSISKIMDGIFKESKVDKVLEKYFVISESEKPKTKKNPIEKLSETVEQQLAAEFILSENPETKILGKTNKGNLVLEHKGVQIKVTANGEVL